MDEFKPEDELKPDPSDRRPGRSRKPDEFDKEPQINVDDVDIDADERRPSRSRREREEEVEDEYEGDDGMAAEPRPARGRKKSAKQKVPVSRQHMMMGIGILVLLLLIIGIGSALKAPSSSPDSAEQKPGAEKSIDLSGSNSAAPADQANGAQPGSAPASGQQNPQDVSLPPISSTPTQAQNQPQPEGQQRVEVPGNLNNALTQPQQQGQIDNVVSNSTLPTEPATVAPIAGVKTEPRKLAGTQEPTRNVESRPERKKTVIEPVRKAEPKQQVKTESKPVATAKHSEPAPAVSAPVKAPSTSVAVPTQAPKETASVAPKAEAKAEPKSAATAPAGASVTGDASAIKGAPGSHYTLQLSSSSNSANLNAWAKKENLQHYVVYQTQRNGQPWYVLVSGVYATKDDAKRAVSTLPADVQAKNPWAKPIHQVQSDLK